MTVYKITDSEYEKYIKLIVRRDQYRKEACIRQEEYLREFGDEMYALYEAKVCCIELKKKIHYCQAKLNRGEVPDEERMEAFVSNEMQEYYQELKKLGEDLLSVKDVKVSPAYVVTEVKKLYREIAKMIHPDICPKAQEDEILHDLWERSVEAYGRNDKDELNEVKMLAIRRLGELGIDVDAEVEIEDLDEKIREVEDEIETILNTDPYQYRELLNHPDLVEERHEEILDELERFQKHRIELEEILESFFGGGIRIV